MSSDDRTTKARIRDSAITEIASRPAGSTTVRDIAAAAEVSPGSVIHHYGSMDGLHQACNEHITALIHKFKSEAVAPQPAFNVLDSLQASIDLPITAYISKVLMTDSPVVADLVDELVADAVEYMDEGVRAGTVLPTDDPHGRAAVLMMWTLGGLVLHEHTKRLLGADITDRDGMATAAAAPYVMPALELMAHGILTDDFASQMKASLETAYGITSPDSTDEQPEGES